MIRNVVVSGWRLCLNVLSAPLWKALVVLCGLGVVGGLVAIACLWHKSAGTPGGEETEDVGDDPIDIADVEDGLARFRAKWNIRGRFEKWPALAPLAEMSNSAYAAPPKAEEDFERLGFASTTLIDSPLHSQVGYVASGDEVMVLVFRGTDDAEDWFSNINVYRRAIDEGEIHSGFAGAYSMIRAEVRDQVAAEDPAHLWITGHSLGGALALVCAYDLLRYDDRDIRGVVTFGQPRIGDERLARYLQEQIGDRYVHFVNEMDAVPHLPMRFSHCGLLLRFFRGRVQKSVDYFRPAVGAPKGEAAVPRSLRAEYDPIGELPPLPPERRREFLETYDGDKPSGPRRLMATDEPPTVGAVPWKADHSMERYLEKIRTAIERASE